MQGRFDSSIRGLVVPNSLVQFAAKHSLSSEVLRNMVADLIQNRGRAIVHAGSLLSEDVHVAVHYLNEVLGNSQVYSGVQAPASFPELASPAAFAELVDKMNSGAVGVVVHCDTNPVYHLPRDLGYEQALQRVPFTGALSESENETSAGCTVTLPIHHALESWGDFEARSGIYSLRQPVVAPLYDTRQLEGVILSWARGGGSYTEGLYHNYLKSHWEESIFPALRRRVDFQTFWHSALHDGVVLRETARRPSRRFRLSAVAELHQNQFPAEYVVALKESPFLGDGRFANNGWMQELPHPVSKVVWDNYAAVAPRTAEELGVETGDRLTVIVDGNEQTFPVFVQPGSADKFVSISLGYGRWQAGPVGTQVGTDAGPLQSADALRGSRILTGGSVKKSIGRHELVTTQEHHSLDDEFVKDLHKKREIIREGTIEGYATDPKFLKHEEHELKSITGDIEYKGVKWAMAIDLNKCVGCNACVSGCSVENNIPVVGKDEVRIGREMQWIRIDRYYSGTPDEPSMSHQPMLCQHCDNAPCEKVCPVVATNHSPDGLNQMTYNRCVGTKYCSNNCPYKVRRFNFYDYRDFVADGYYEQQPINLMHNPEVTVRSRGVMEKCTFCVQRIADARQGAVQEGREVRGSDVRTACQEACPAEAIVFGDMNDPSSHVSRLRGHDLGYHVLEGLLVRPNVTYIARLRNVHTESNG
jgi:molybdopterin-containing oxidoreductase family iron-sulfur binding subunit